MICCLLLGFIEVEFYVILGNEWKFGDGKVDWYKWYFGKVL